MSQWKAKYNIYMAPDVIKSYKIYKMVSYVTIRGQTHMAPYFINSSEIWCGSVCRDKRQNIYLAPYVI